MPGAGPSRLWDAITTATKNAAAGKSSEPFTVELEVSKKDLDALASGLKGKNLVRLLR